MNIKQAIEEIDKLKHENKFNTMIHVAAIITKLLDAYHIKPIIVGGLSVEIYTDGNYTTRDIDFISPNYEIVSEVLISLKFKKEGRHFYREDIEVAIEIPGDHLAGDMSKVRKLYLANDSYVYIISKEDIILDRLRAAVHWKSKEDALWAIKILQLYFEDIDIGYLLNNTETPTERNELEHWITTINKDK